MNIPEIKMYFKVERATFLDNKISWAKLFKNGIFIAYSFAQAVF